MAVPETPSLSSGPVCAAFLQEPFGNTRVIYFCLFLWFFVCFYLAALVLSGELRPEVSTGFSVGSAHVGWCRRNAGTKWDVILRP